MNISQNERERSAAKAGKLRLHYGSQVVQATVLPYEEIECFRVSNKKKTVGTAWVPTAFYNLRI